MNKISHRDICSVVLTLQTPRPSYPTQGTSQSPEGVVAASVKVDETSAVVIVTTLPVGV
jgi:hypothetical protein